MEQYQLLIYHHNHRLLARGEHRPYVPPKLNGHPDTYTPPEYAVIHVNTVQIWQGKKWRYLCSPIVDRLANNDNFVEAIAVQL